MCLVFESPSVYLPPILSPWMCTYTQVYNIVLFIFHVVVLSQSMLLSLFIQFIPPSLSIWLFQDLTPQQHLSCRNKTLCHLGKAVTHDPTITATVAKMGLQQSKTAFPKNISIKHEALSLQFGNHAMWRFCCSFGGMGSVEGQPSGGVGVSRSEPAPGGGEG